MYRFIRFERWLFYLLVLCSGIVMYMMFDTGISFSDKKQQFIDEQYAAVDMQMQIKLREAVTQQKEATLDMAVSAVEVVALDPAVKAINLPETETSLAHLSREISRASRYKRIHYSLIGRDGTVLYRSWSEQHGDTIPATHEANQLLQGATGRIETVSVDDTTLQFSVLEPLYMDDVVVGVLEVSTSFDTLVQYMKGFDEEIVVLVDQRYTAQLKRARSPYYLDNYNVVNAKANTPELLRAIDRAGVDSLIASSLYLNVGNCLANISNVRDALRGRNQRDAYKVFDAYLLVNNKIKSCGMTDIAYIFYFKKRDSIELKGLNAISDTMNRLVAALIILAGLFLMIMIVRFVFIGRIRQSTIFDFKTQLPNQIRLLEIIDENGYDERMLVIMDINHFSNINILYGFEAGDQILLAVAHRLKSICDCLEVFHLGADEFALLYRAEMSPRPVVKQLQDHFYDNPMTYGAFTINLTFSYGAATRTEHLFRHASFALKQAKSFGSNRFHIYDELHDRLDQEARELMMEKSRIIHEAIKQDHIVPFFQGIRNNTVGRIDKYETLTRVIYRERPHPLKEFNDAVKATGMISQITRIMIDKTFRYMQDKTCDFSFNISEEDLDRNYLPEYLKQKLDEYRIRPDRVIIEILEGVSAAGKKNHVDQFKGFKAIGMQLAIDDFGSEYSNFERVLDLDIDYLKIDSKYIKDIDVNLKSYEIVRAIAFFSQNSEIACIAEYVTSEEIQVIIERLGIEYSQGYLFSKPKSHIKES